MNLREASGIVWETVLDWYYSMLGLAALNLLWVALSLTIVLLPPATAGVYAIANGIAHGQGHQWQVFWTSARRYGWVSIRWALLNVAVVVMLSLNIMFYATMESLLSVVVQIAFVIGGALWIATQFYFWPFMFEQEQKCVRVALKNALFLVLAEPFFTAVMLSTAALIIVVSSKLVLPLAVFALSFISLLANRAVIDRLKTYGKLQHSDPTSINGD